MAEFVGDVERFFADLYPYRWPLTIIALLLTAGAVGYAFKRGLHLLVWERRLAVAIVGTPLLAAVVVGGWWLGSPLFTSKTVIEEFPFAFNAVVPPDMTRDNVEDTMASMARFNQRMTEAMPVSMVAAATGAVKVKAGTFQDADQFHKGSGQAGIYRSPDGGYLLRLENLNVTNGPDLHVVLSPHPSPDSRSDVKVPGYVDLGKLKGNKGDQNYEIPNGVDIEKQGSVVIYCKPFAVVFSVATLEDREFPLAAAAVVPPDMARARVEQIMAGMAAFDQEVSESMADAGLDGSGNEAAHAGTTLMEGGIVVLQLGTDTSDMAVVDRGLAMVEQGAAMSGTIAVVEDGLNMTRDGVAQADAAMTDKGAAMVQEAVEEAEKTVDDQPVAVKLKAGSLRDADSFHKGSGRATIYRGPDGSHLLRLENLDVTNGPELHVVLTPHADPDSGRDVKTAGYVDLGRLKGNKGDQNYPIPDDVDIAAQLSLVIYCKPFSVVFSVASLEEVT